MEGASKDEISNLKIQASTDVQHDAHRIGCPLVRKGRNLYKVD